MHLSQLMELAGFFTAHLAWTASTRPGPLAPILVMEGGGERELTRFEDIASMEDAVEKARELLEANAGGAERGVILYDAFVTIGEARTDAIVVEAVEFGEEPIRVEVIQPYRARNDDEGFAVHKPKLSLPPEHSEDADELVDAFFRGLSSHEEGGPLWDDPVPLEG